jgi:hypothetical protein
VRVQDWGFHVVRDSGNSCFGFARQAANHQGNTAFGNARLLERDLRQRVPEVTFVIEGDRRDRS